MVLWAPCLTSRTPYYPVKTVTINARAALVVPGVVVGKHCIKVRKPREKNYVNEAYY